MFVPNLTKHRTAIIATDGFEELELIEPLRALRAEGVEVDIIAPHAGPIQGMHHFHKTVRIHVDRVLSDTVRPEQYDSLVLPGGPIHADSLRTNALVLDFVRAMNEAEKPIAAICHAAWILISAGVANHRKLTSFHTLRDDIINASGIWVDNPVVVDGNLITARSARELAAFDSAMIELFGQGTAMISPETRHLFARSRIA